MPEPALLIEPLARHHDRASFDCGHETLNRYLHRQAGQDLRERAAVTFVMSDRPTGSTAGYYTLTSCQIHAGELPGEIAKRLPRYPCVPATLLGRLAVARRFQGQSLGKILLFDALNRSLIHSREVVSLAVVVDAMDDAARDFYESRGFVRLPDQSHRLFLLMDTIEKGLR